MARKKKKPEAIVRIPTELVDCEPCDGTGVRPVDQLGDSAVCNRCKGRGQILRVVGQSPDLDEEDMNDEEDC